MEPAFGIYTSAWGIGTASALVFILRTRSTQILFQRTPPTWWSNLILSSILYFCAGMFWNLDWKAEKGVIFPFRETRWPYASTQRVFTKVIWIGLPFMAVVAWLTLGFLSILNR